MAFVRYCTAIHQLSVSEMHCENIFFKSTAPASYVPVLILDRSRDLFPEQGISPLIGSWNPSYPSITGAWDKQSEGGLKGVGDVFIVCFGNLVLFRSFQPSLSLSLTYSSFKHLAEQGRLGPTCETDAIFPHYRARMASTLMSPSHWGSMSNREG